MKLINISYDCEYDYETDTTFIEGYVDLMSVPDFVADNVERFQKEFLDWTCKVYKEPKEKNPQYWTTYDGYDCLGFNSEHFAEWLNENYSSDDGIAEVLQIGVTYNPKYPTVCF